MTEKKSKYDTDPLDPDFVRRTEPLMGGTGGVGAGEETTPLPRRDPALEEPTRRFGEELSDSYPSVFVPPTYQPPRAPQPQPFTTFGAGPHQPPATTAPPPGPSSPYNPAGAYGYQQQPGPSSRPVEKLGIPENIANVLPYLPFWIGLVAAVVELIIVPRTETRTRFHAAQGLAVQLAITAGSIAFDLIGGVTGRNFGGTI
ncbi:MAG TPA: hypothetical protein VD968_03015, partial [Pyrinomonadaceae bacterium]|nr:hypothetical protein [Pyrinomonadaceae bacterium]